MNVWGVGGNSSQRESRWGNRESGSLDEAHASGLEASAWQIGCVILDYVTCAYPEYAWYSHEKEGLRRSIADRVLRKRIAQPVVNSRFMFS